jgi:hypothetical protein
VVPGPQDAYLWCKGLITLGLNSWFSPVYHFCTRLLTICGVFLGIYELTFGSEEVGTRNVVFIPPVDDLA